MGACITAGPNRALIKSGTCAAGEDGNGPQVTGDGGCIFVMPFCQTYGELDLTIKTIQLHSQKVLSKKGVDVSLHGVAQVRINKAPTNLDRAASQFLGMPPGGVSDVVERTMEGHQRAIIGAMTMEQLYSDRHEFAKQVREVCKEDFQKMGMEVVSYVITDITDDNRYFDSLGVARIEEVKKNAEVGREKYTSEVKINMAMCQAQVKIEQVQREREATEKDQEVQRHIAEYKKDFTVKNTEYQQNIREVENKADYDVNLLKAGYDLQLNKAVAAASAATEIEVRRQNVTLEQENERVMVQKKKVELVEKQGDTKITQEQVAIKEQELEAQLVKPADKKATAQKTIANADAQVKVTLAEADATRIKFEAGASAEATKVQGEAQAEVIEKKGLAEAKAMEAKAAAWAQYTQGAYIDMILQQLPEIADRIAKPLSKTEKIVMISNGGDGSGAQKLTKEITSMIAELPAVAQGLTGIDVREAIANMSSGKRGGL